MIDNLLNQAADPYFVISSDGEMYWSNKAFKTLYSSLTNLNQLVDDKSYQEILNCKKETSLQILISKNKIKQTAQILNISAADPDSDLKLIGLKSYLSEQEQIEQREHFLATLTHDLKNPIGAIFGYSDVLLDTATGASLDDKQRQIISKIRTTASRSIELIRNHQVLSQIQDQGLQTKLIGESDLNQVVSSVIEYTWRDQKNSPSLDLQLCDKPLALKVNRMQIDRIISNLFSNALKYTPANGQIKIKTWSDQSKVHFSIKNSPANIPEDNLAKIFERFQRASNSQDIPGSGLGLYIVKLILDSIDGRIELINQENSVEFKIHFN